MILVFFGMFVMILAVCIFSNTSGLLMLPLTSPEMFLAGMPYTTISLFGREMVLIQPSSTFFVYFLGVVMITIGIYFLATKKQQKSRYFWGTGLILWGISAIVAGTSYQAFGYELKVPRASELPFYKQFRTGIYAADSLLHQLPRCRNRIYQYRSKGQEAIADFCTGRQRIIFGIFDYRCNTACEVFGFL